MKNVTKLSPIQVSLTVNLHLSDAGNPYNHIYARVRAYTNFEVASNAGKMESFGKHVTKQGKLPCKTSLFFQKCNNANPRPVSKSRPSYYENNGIEQLLSSTARYLFGKCSG